MGGHPHIVALLRGLRLSVVSRVSSRQRRENRMRRVSVPILGIGALGLVKTADAVTTVLGLTRLPGAIEQNPLVAASISSLGLGPGLGAVIIGSVILVTVVTEIVGVAVAEPTDGGETRRLIRFVGFGSAVLCSLVPVVSNTLVLLDHGILL
jgi:hypothetical protein